MAVTLAEFVKTAANEGQTLVPLYGNWFLRESNVLQLIPWASDKNLAVKITSMKTLPTVGWRKINGTPSESTGLSDQKIESKYIFGHYIDVDKVLVEADPNARMTQRQMSAEAMAFEFNDQFINGDPANDEFKGISKRIDDIYADGYTDQKFDAGSATTGRGMLYDTTDRQYFMDNVAKLIHVIDKHKPDALFMNSKMYLAFEAALRREGVLKQDADMFGRIINTYSSVSLIDIGIKADQSTEIITNAETGSGGTDETSIYAVKYGEGTDLWGIQQKALEVTDQGLYQGKPVYRDLVEWVVGLAVANPRALARAYGFVADNGAS